MVLIWQRPTWYSELEKYMPKEGDAVVRKPENVT